MMVLYLHSRAHLYISLIKSGFTSLFACRMSRILSINSSAMSPRTGKQCSTFLVLRKGCWALDLTYGLWYYVLWLFTNLSIQKNLEPYPPPLIALCDEYAFGCKLLNALRSVVFQTLKPWSFRKFPLTSKNPFKYQCFDYTRVFTTKLIMTRFNTFRCLRDVRW